MFVAVHARQLVWRYAWYGNARQEGDGRNAGDDGRLRRNGGEQLQPRYEAGSGLHSRAVQWSMLPCMTHTQFGFWFYNLAFDPKTCSSGMVPKADSEPV